MGGSPNEDEEWQRRQKSLAGNSTATTATTGRGGSRVGRGWVAGGSRGLYHFRFLSFEIFESFEISSVLLFVV